jgi:hypothetical protein
MENSNAKTQTTIAVFITVIWAITVIAEIFVSGYSVSIAIHGIMGSVVGYLFSNKDFNINIGGSK